MSGWFDEWAHRALRSTTAVPPQGSGGLVYLQVLSTSRASSMEATMRPTSSIAPWTKRLTPVDSPRVARMSVRSPTMPFFDGSDCISAWNIPISHAVPSSTDGPSRIASMASARSIPGRSFAKIHAAVTRRELVLVRNEDLEAVGAQRGGALVDERALVGREERTGEIDLQGADATEPLPAFKQVQ